MRRIGLLTVALIALGCGVHDHDRIVLAPDLDVANDAFIVLWSEYASRMIESEWQKAYKSKLRRIQLQSVAVDEAAGLATFVGCAETAEWPRQRRKTVVLAQRTAEGWHCHHFEILHDAIDGPPTHCGFTQ